jgi:sigma-E factor negative regulatory protein RseA
MNTNTSMQARISAFVDGESSPTEIEAVLRELQTPAGRLAWDDYHRIGELARSKDMAVSMSDGFAARMAARLEAEPTVLAPAAAKRATAPAVTPARRYAAPAMAAVAMAALAFVVTPPILKSMQGQPETAAPAVVASSVRPAISHASVIAAATPVATSSATLHDVDAYVLAHQRLSPAVQSSEQNAQAAAGGAAK